MPMDDLGQDPDRKKQPGDVAVDIVYGYAMLSPECPIRITDEEAPVSQVECGFIAKERVA